MVLSKLSKEQLIKTIEKGLQLLLDCERLWKAKQPYEENCTDIRYDIDCHIKIVTGQEQIIECEVCHEDLTQPDTLIIKNQGRAFYHINKEDGSTEYDSYSNDAGKLILNCRSCGEEVKREKAIKKLF